MSINDGGKRYEFGEEENFSFDPQDGEEKEPIFEEDEQAEWATTQEIPSLEGLDREFLRSDVIGEDENTPSDDMFFSELFDDPEEKDDRYSYDPRDDEDFSIPLDELYDEQELPVFSERKVYEEPHPRKKRYTFSFGFIVSMTVFIIVLAIGVAIALYTGYDFGLGTVQTTDAAVESTNAQTEAKTNTENAPAETTAKAETEPPKNEPSSITVRTEEADRGALILVNKAHKYEFPEIETESLYEYKNDSYKISSSTIELEKTTATALNEMAAAFEAATGKHDLIVASGIRSYDEQLDIYSARVDKQGLENAKKYVAEPGFSEHHTGLSFDLSIYTDEGVGMLISDSAEHGWVTEHCYEYGFILRYDDAKAEITGISEEDWHFRYVGRAHAYYMTANELCLEEYIDLVKGHTVEDRLGFNEPNGTRYEVYFVSASDGEQTDIPLLREDGISTQISGTNSGGFIVTVTYGKE